MKNLVIGDIHGNLPALERVLNFERNEVDGIICHGDVVNYGPWSNECVELLDDIGCICIMGNHEEAYLNGYYPGSNPMVQQFFAQTYPEFKHQKVIAQYRASYVQGSYEVQHTLGGGYYYPDSDLSNIFLNIDTIIGHSHYSFQKVCANGRTLINTGSVGQNSKDLSVIEYVVLDDVLGAKIKSLNYDPSLVIGEMVKRNYPEQCVNYYRSKLNK